VARLEPQRLADVGGALVAEAWNVVQTGNAQVTGAMHPATVTLPA
jgi:hypothetical protein